MRAWLIVSLITAGAIWISDLATSGGYLNMTPGQREQYEMRCTPERLEREKLLSSECTSDLSADSLMQPQSDISIRNRYLSRIGAMVSLSENCVSSSLKKGTRSIHVESIESYR